MRNMSIVGLGLVALGVAGPAAAAPAAGAKAVPFVEFTDAGGSPPSINGPGNDRHVVKARLESDGSNILVSATLSEDEHGTIAGHVLDMYLDTDGNPQTGGAAHWGQQLTPPKRGYEYRAQLSVCLAWNENIGACAGGAASPPKSRHARIVLDRFKGEAGAVLDMMSSDSLISGFGPAGDPLTGRVLQGKIPYAKLGVKPGQAIRVSTQGAGVSRDEGFFPDAVLALK
jgi:hypothetical protein